MSNVQKIPKLRFPGFVGEWEATILGGIATFSKGKGISKEDISEGGMISCIRYGELYTHYGELIIEVKSKTHLDKNELIFSEENDVIIPASGETSFDIAKASCVLNAGIALGGDLNIIKTKENGVFLSYYLNTRKKQDIASLAQGGSVVHLYSSQLKTLKLHLPALPEQQKIAYFLTAIDEKINQLTRQKALLEQYKKGVMQQIFSRELRFRDAEGRAFGEWEEKRLGEVAKIYDGTHQTPNYVEKGIPFYSVEHLTRDDFSNTKFISEEVFQKENQRVQLEKGDILMTRIGDIGTSKYISWDVQASFYVSLALIKRSPKFNSKYLNQYIGSVAFQNELHKRTIHVAFPQKINLGEIGECIVQFPTLPEQQKIADFLTALDEKIGRVAGQVEAVKGYKKGLLQGMFV
jgi:type I restriction enzyme S subunit